MVQMLNGSWNQTIAELLNRLVELTAQSGSELVTTLAQHKDEIVQSNDKSNIELLLNQLIESNDKSNIELLLSQLIESNDKSNIELLLEQIKDKIQSPVIITETKVIRDTKYINTETTKYIYVKDKNEVKEPTKTTQITNKDISDGWLEMEGTKWRYKKDAWGRTYWRIGNGRVMSDDEKRRWDRSPNDNKYHNATMNFNSGGSW